MRNGLMLELWLGVCPEADTQGLSVYPEQYPLLNKDIQQHVASTGEAMYLEECRDRAVAAIQADPRRYLGLCGLRSADYWLGTVFTHAGPGGGGWPGTTVRQGVAVFLSVELLVAVVCLVMAPARRRDALWLLAIIFVCSLVYCATHVQVRFPAPTEPLLAIVIAIFVMDMCDAWLLRRGGVTSSCDADEALESQ